MSSRASRPRPVSSRSRRQRLAAGAVLATTSILGTYLAAIRPQPTYASPNSGGTTQEPASIGMGPASFNPAAITCEVTVDDSTKLHNAILNSVDDSVICVQGAIVLTAPLPTIDDTRLTLAGAGTGLLDDSIIVNADDSAAVGSILKSVGTADDTLTIHKLGFVGGYAPDNGVGAPTGFEGWGGAIFTDEAGVSTPGGPALIVTSSIFEDNGARLYGGAINVWDGGSSAIIADSVFTGNTSLATGLGGGAIYSNGALVVTRSTFSENSANDGGAIFADGELILIDDTFNRNEARNRGGSIRATDGVSTITGSSFSDDSAVSDGGSIWTDDSITISGSSFSNAYSGSDGGAVYINNVVNVVIQETDFNNNQASSNGGAVYVDDEAYVTIAQSQFRGNRAITGYGGALRNDGASQISNSSFVNNESERDGGGAYLRNGAVITGSTFERNRTIGSGRKGGAVYFNSSAGLRIETSSFAGNSATREGGAVYADDSTVVIQSSFIGNHANQHGGAIFLDDDTLTVRNSYFGRNSAGQEGGSLGLDSGTNAAVIEFSTFYDDTAVNTGQSIYMESNTTLNLVASVIGSSSDDSLIAGNGTDNTLEDTFAVVTGQGSLALSGTGSQTVATGSLELQPLNGDDTGQAGRAPAATSVLVTGAPTSDLGTGVTVDQLGVTRGQGNPAIWTIGARQVEGGSTPDPGPTPVPPSAPGGVLGVPGDGRVTVRWTAPASAGSFPVSSYQAVLAPGGQSCLVAAPTVSCTITGLENGTSYTAQVRALSGAGWGAYSSASAPFTPAVDPVPPTPSVQPIPAPLAPGASFAQENGQPITIEVTPDAQDTGVVITGDGFGMNIDGLDAQGRPLNLGADGVLVLREEREVFAEGNGFAPGTSVGLYIDPPVAASGSSVRAAEGPVLVGTVTVDANGEFAGTGELPEGIAEGDHVVQAIGIASSGADRAVSLGVRVEADRSIMITGTRAEVRGRAGVKAEGVTTGLVGEQVTPRVKLAGETRYAVGVGVRTVNAEGEFTWQRITGKKVYVFFEADGVRSNRIILPR